MRYYTLIVVALISAKLLTAEDFTPSHNSTADPVSGRYEIIQSSLAAKWTFKLDKYTGRIWQLVNTLDDENAWQETPVSGRPILKASTKARFQIFTSSLAARHTFLLDAETGKTWSLASETYYEKDGTKVEDVLWEPFAR